MERHEIAQRLFSMPLNRVMDALEAIEELDHLILAMHQEHGDIGSVNEWRQKMQDRQAGRQSFLRARIAAEHGLLMRVRR